MNPNKYRNGRRGPYRKKQNRKYEDLDFFGYDYFNLPHIFSIWLKWLYHAGGTIEQYTAGNKNTLQRGFLPIYKFSLYQYLRGEFYQLDICKIAIIRKMLIKFGYPEKISIGQLIDVNNILIPHKNSTKIYNPDTDLYQIIKSPKQARRKSNGDLLQHEIDKLPSEQQIIELNKQKLTYEKRHGKIKVSKKTTKTPKK